MAAYKFLLACSALVLLMLSYTSWRRRAAPGAPALAVILASSAWWLFCHIVPLAGMSETESAFLRAQIIFPGVVLIPPATLALALTFTGKLTALRRGQLAALAIEPVVVLVSVAVPALHEYFYGTWRGQVLDGPFVGGPVYWVHSIYAYALLCKAVILLLAFYRRGTLVLRRQTAYMLVALLIPLVCNVSFVLRLLPLNVDLTPLGLVVMGALLSLALFRRGLMDLLTVAREKIAAAIPDGYVVVDANRHIVDINPAMGAMMMQERVAVGQPLRKQLPELDAAWPDLADGAARVELPLDDGRYLELRVFTILHDDGKLFGHVVLVRDITQLKADAMALEKANVLLREQVVEIEQMRLLLQEQVVRDPLTGLFNRRFLDEMLEQQVRLATRNETAVTVVMIDIDHFKAINDTYGHAAGDDVLRALGRLLSQCSRAADSACRFGGEEFVVVMAGSSPEAAVLRVNEWRIAFAALDHTASGGPADVSLSAGLAAFPRDGVDAGQVLAAADAALYAAKKAGRNVVVQAAGAVLE
jgi:diguanylate cyclase (GGDEF)-like protein